MITSANVASVAENTTAVLQVAATDVDTVGGPLTFGLSGNGADDGLFQIDGAGNLSFIAAPDFENPQGSGGNDYQVEVEVSDGVNTTTQVIDVSVTDVNDDAPVITSPNIGVDCREHDGCVAGDCDRHGASDIRAER